MHAELAGETLSIICVNPCPSVAFPKAEFRRALTTWYRKHGRDLPWRRTRDPYAILVSEFMLQQTQVATVIPYYHEWLRQFPDFAALNRASENDILRAWQGLGYYARARNLHATARSVVDRFRGRFPRSIDQMQRLPGIGKYTAHAIASFAFSPPDRSKGRPGKTLGACGHSCSRALRAHLQLCAHRSWRARLSASPTAMRHLPRQKTLSREKSGDSPHEERTASDGTVDRKSCAHHSGRQDSA